MLKSILSRLRKKSIKVLIAEQFPSANFGDLSQCDNCRNFRAIIPSKSSINQFNISFDHDDTHAINKLRDNYSDYIIAERPAYRMRAGSPDDVNMSTHRFTITYQAKQC